MPDAIAQFGKSPIFVGGNLRHHLSSISYCDTVKLVRLSLAFQVSTENFLYCDRRMGRRRLLSRFREFLLPVALLLARGCAEVQTMGMPRLIPAAEILKSTAHIPVVHVKLVRAYPHDPHAFTQGLEYYGGFL